MNVYKKDQEMIIRSMISTDADDIYERLLNQGWHPNLKTYQDYLLMQESGERIIFIAEKDKHVAGYVTLVMNASYGPFKNKHIPMIIDLNVFKIFQHQGIGTKLLDALESYVKDFASAICLGVGLHEGYGQAQKLYVKRGYIPDGSGVWYQENVVKPYATTINDDDLNLYFIKFF